MGPTLCITMSTEIWKEFHFDSAHFLPSAPADHKCKRIHGHTFRVRLGVRGTVDPVLGWICDFADLTSAWKPLHEILDHRLLNEIDGLHNPTSEVLAAWIARRITPALPDLAWVEVAETCTSGCRYTPGENPALVPT